MDVFNANIDETRMDWQALSTVVQSAIENGDYETNAELESAIILIRAIADGRASIAAKAA